jgi:hypothetical protein
MLQVFSVAMLCIAHRADDRPAMKDVVALLKEVKRPAEGGEEGKEQPASNSAAAATAAPAVEAKRSPARSPLPKGGSSSCSFAMSDYSS